MSGSNRGLRVYFTAGRKLVLGQSGVNMRAIEYVETVAIDELVGYQV